MAVCLSSEYDVRCQRDSCSTYLVITDYERGEIVCGGCGCVLMQNITDLSHDAAKFYQEGHIQTARTGPATSLAMYDRGLPTVIGGGRDSSGNLLSTKIKHEFRRLRVWDQRSKDRTTAAMSKAFTMLHAMKTKLGIPDNVVETAAYLYRKAVSVKLTRGRTMTSLVSASLYAACREHGIPRTLDDIAKAGNVEKRLLSRGIRLMIQKLGLDLDQYNTTSFITKISNNANLKEKTKRDAFFILKRCEQKRITAGKHPVAQAAASLYIACLINNENISQKRFAKEAGISEVTIRNRVLLIRKTLNLPQ